MAVEWEVLREFPARQVNEQKHCGKCELTFKTQREAAQHVVDSHKVIRQEKHGLFIYELHAEMPWGSRDRLLHTTAKAFYNGHEIPHDWSLKTFVEGAIWMKEHLRA